MVIFGAILTSRFLCIFAFRKTRGYRASQRAARQACKCSVTADFRIASRRLSLSIFLPDTAAKWPNEMRDVVGIKCDLSSWLKLRELEGSLALSDVKISAAVAKPQTAIAKAQTAIAKAQKVTKYWCVVSRRFDCRWRGLARNQGDDR